MPMRKARNNFAACLGGPCAALLAAWLLSACASAPAPKPVSDADLTAIRYSGQFDFLDAYDPFEPVNRRIYRFNARFDDFVALPTLRVYHAVLPAIARKGIANFFSNIDQIPVFANLVLQLKPKRSLVTLGRLAVNTTVGIGGLWDPATRLGLKKYREDFGQTLGHYGLGPGPFLVLPVLGPSSARDGLGLVTDRIIRGEVDLFGFDTAEWEFLPLLALEALNQRDANPFRYGEFGSPFEYDLVRFLYLRRRTLEFAD
jgi:phospholipid-binding lipoprotein MlaA